MPTYVITWVPGKRAMQVAQYKSIVDARYAALYRHRDSVDNPGVMIYRSVAQPNGKRKEILEGTLFLDKKTDSYVWISAETRRTSIVNPDTGYIDKEMRWDLIPYSHSIKIVNGEWHKRYPLPSAKPGSTRRKSKKTPRRS